GAWKLANTGQARGEMTLSRERTRSGQSAVRLRCPTNGTVAAHGSRYFGTASATRTVAGENWSAWNRLSFWLYPDVPGFRVVSLLVKFHNEGQERVPDEWGKMGLNYVLLRNHEWNQVVWEIANLPRDRVTGVEFFYLMQGHEPGASDSVTFDIDRIELQKVDADHYEGWNVAPGEIAFSHSGYQPGAPKSAIASGLNASSFDLINVATGVPALSKRVTSVESAIGRFDVMDFTEVREPGTYIVRVGGRTTRPFRIADDTWEASLWKAINFFYVERCGYAIPGVHDICHRDWEVRHGDRKLVMNGGWHDAGDLSQSFMNTAETTFAMFRLYERLVARQENAALAARLADEAKWGLDWLLKTTFHDGFRPDFATLDRWTDGIVGTADDMPAEASNDPGVNYSAAAAEALAARLLRASDPVLAGYSLKQAEEDWTFAAQAEPNWEWNNPTDFAGHAILASLELWQATGNRKYADHALGLARTIVDAQQRTFVPGLKLPLAGFFYTGPDRKRVLRYMHPSHEDAPVEALARLCELFPEHSDWMKWYSSAALYSEYFQKSMARLSEPYGMLANSIFRDDDYLQIPERGGWGGMNREGFRRQVLRGVKVGEHHYVRLFPVWFEFRGNYGTMLTQANGIAKAAHLRGNLELAGLAERQLQWVAGRNPFVQSTMWGEGYDYAPQYTAMSGDIVGSLPVGIQSHGDADAPYWPTENCHNWKEVWVLPVARWIALMRELEGPALVTGAVEAGFAGPVELREISTGRVTRFVPDSATARFRGFASAGEYEVSAGGERRTLTALAGGSYTLDLRRGRGLDLRVAQETGADGAVTIRVTAAGAGTHRLALRTDNLALEEPEPRAVTLKAGASETVVWRGKTAAADAPWVAVLVPDDDLGARKELTGAALR
ncbi:MAG TPA: glycoside hydrolase family 9 protein, partial [Bryobacteraceae bacterium]|nr:glycoside hydrolase family 9 protein [Bryobacteraceae bacterium]